MRHSHKAISLIEVAFILVLIAVLSYFLLALPLRPFVPEKRASITLELQQIGNALEDLKNEYGSFPPNLITNSVEIRAGNAEASPEVDVLRMFKKAFPRNKEPESLLLALAGKVDESGVAAILAGGMTPGEAVFFWLGGFSDDVQYPISGIGGPSFSDAEGNGDGVLGASDERVRSRRLRCEFDWSRLGPQTGEGIFDDQGLTRRKGRFVEYDDPRDGTRRRINLWRYYPERSNVAIVYFDVSRHTPSEYYPVVHPTSVGSVGPLMQLCPEASPESTVRDDLEFVEQGKFQLLHAGIDGVWGDFSGIRSGEIIVPKGPFLGDIADTLANFMSGTLEDKQE